MGPGPRRGLDLGRRGLAARAARRTGLVGRTMPGLWSQSLAQHHGWAWCCACRGSQAKTLLDPVQLWEATRRPSRRRAAGRVWCRRRRPAGDRMSTTPATGGTGKQSARVRVEGVSTEPGDSDADGVGRSVLGRPAAAPACKRCGMAEDGRHRSRTVWRRDAPQRRRHGTSPVAERPRPLPRTTAFAAFITVAASIVLASLAAQPRTIEIPADIAGRREAQTAAFAYTRSRLRASRWCAGAAMITLWHPSRCAGTAELSPSSPGTDCANSAASTALERLPAH